MADTAVNDLFGEIESMDFAAELGPANDLHAIRRLASENPAFDRLVLQARGDTRVAAEVRKEIERLLEVDVDPRMLHPYDRAITAYLLVLHLSNIGELEQALKLIYNSQPPNLWWTYRAYNVLRLHIPSQLTARNQVELADIQDATAGMQPLRRVELPKVDSIDSITNLQFA